MTKRRSNVAESGFQQSFRHLADVQPLINSSPLLLPVPLNPAGLGLQAAVPPIGAIDGLGREANRLQQGAGDGSELGGVGGEGGPEAALGGKRSEG